MPSLTDSLSNLMEISIVHSDSVPLPTIGTNQQLCHLRLNVTGLSTTSVEAYFDTLAMAGRSMYQQTIYGIEFPYDKILVSGLVGSLRSNDSVYLSIANTVLTYSPLPTYLDFDIVGNDIGTNYLAGYSISLSYILRQDRITNKFDWGSKSYP